MLLPRGRALNSADSMNNKIIALVSIGVAAITFMSCKCAWAGSAQELTVTPTANNTNAPITVRTASGALGSIKRLDPALDALLAKDAVIEKLAKGFDWSEGPVWMPGDYLLFSDVPQNAIFKWDARSGVSIFLRPSGYTGTEPRGGEPGSNGLTRDKQGRLIACQQGDRRVGRWENGKFVAEIGRVSGAINLPLYQIRHRLHELPRDRESLALLWRRSACALCDVYPFAERLSRKEPSWRISCLSVDCR